MYAFKKHQHPKACKMSTIKSASTYQICTTQSSKTPPIAAAQHAKKAAEHDHIQ